MIQSSGLPLDTPQFLCTSMRLSVSKAYTWMDFRYTEEVALVSTTGSM